MRAAVHHAIRWHVHLFTLRPSAAALEEATMKPLALAWAMLLSLLVASPARAAQDVADKHACQVGAPVCVRFVLREMHKRFRTLAQDCDHDAVFALLYQRTTEKFGETLATIGY